MKAIRLIGAAALACLPYAAHAQRWEVGGIGGGSIYTSRDATLGSGPAVKATFSSGYAAGVYVGQQMGRYWGGEIRYMFQRNTAELSGGGAKASFGAQAHSIHYDFLVHLKPTGNRVRPYFSFGAGVKQYRGTGTERVTQPLSDYVLLTRTSDMTALVTAGFGVKMKLGEHGILRFEVRDYLTPVPKKIFAPNRGADLGGWFHSFLPMVGVGYEF